MNVTQFKKQIKGITSSKKKPTPIPHEEYILSGTSDAVVTHNSIIVVVPSFEKDYEVVTDRNKPIAYIVKSLETLKNQDILKKVATVYGINYLFTLDKKQQICTFTLFEEKHVPEVEYKYFVEVTGELGNYETLQKHYTNVIISELGEITKENKKQLQQNAAERGYTEKVREARMRYQEKLEIFITTYGYNPFNYNLKTNI